MWLALTQYTQDATKTYGNKNGTPPKPDNCMALRAHDQGRAGYSYSQCDKKPKTERPARPGRFRDGDPVTIKVCGIHASVHDRAVKREEERKAKADAKKANYEVAQEACTVLKDTYGLEAKPYLFPGFGSSLGTYTGEVVVNPQRLLQILQELEG